MASSFFGRGSSTKLSLGLKVFGSCVIVPSIPVSAWYYFAIQDRQKRSEEVRTKVRIPNVQTIDELMVEKCKPGDVILFDRRCHKCAAGPLSAFSCILSQNILCSGNNAGSINSKRGKDNSENKFDHVGIVVHNPKLSEGKMSQADAYDPTKSLYLMEATASEGIVARPLLTRLEMSQSRTVLLLPLTCPGERRSGGINDDDDDNNRDALILGKTKKLRSNLENRLSNFVKQWMEQSEKQNYGSSHAMLGIIGSLAHLFGLEKQSLSPMSPSAWIVVSALQESGVAIHLNDRTSFETKVEDFLNDHRFHDKSTVRLRPGWKFMPPVILRETSHS